MTTKIDTTLITRTAFCTASSWFERRIRITRHSVGVRLQRVGDASRPASRWTSGRRSSVTSPFSVETFLIFSPLSTAMSCACIRRFASSQSACAGVCAEDRVRGPRRHVLECAGQHRRGGLELVRQLLLQLFGDVDPLEERVDHLCRDGRADGVVREQLAGVIRPAVGIQQLALRPDGQREISRSSVATRDETPDEDLALDAHHERFFWPGR